MKKELSEYGESLRCSTGRLLSGNRKRLRRLKKCGRIWHRKIRERVESSTLPGLTEEEHYTFAAYLCTAFIEGKNVVKIRLDSQYVLPKGFPGGKLVGKDGDYKVLQIKVVRALVWMYEYGYNSYSLESLRKARATSLNAYREIERRLKNVGMD